MGLFRPTGGGEGRGGRRLRNRNKRLYCPESCTALKGVVSDLFRKLRASNCVIALRSGEDFPCMNIAFYFNATSGHRGDERFAKSIHVSLLITSSTRENHYGRRWDETERTGRGTRDKSLRKEIAARGASRCCAYTSTDNSTLIRHVRERVSNESNSFFQTLRRRLGDDRARYPYRRTFQR